MALSTAWGGPLPAASQYGAGFLVWELKGAHVVGRGVGSLPCGLPEGRALFQGELDSGMIVGKVTLCQAGVPRCVARSFPIFGFVSEQGIYASVSLDPGCSSPVARDGRLVWQPVQHLDVARSLMRHGQPDGALRQLQEALKAREEPSEVHYELANIYIHKGDVRRALGALKAALEHGYQNTEQMGRDFAPFFNRDPQFQTLLQHAQEERSRRHAVSLTRPGETR